MPARNPSSFPQSAPSTQPADEPVRVLRKPDVLNRVGLANSALYTLMKQGDFPKPIRLTGKAVAWYEHEIENWLRNRPRSL